MEMQTFQILSLKGLAVDRYILGVPVCVCVCVCVCVHVCVLCVCVCDNSIIFVTLL